MGNPGFTSGWGVGPQFFYSYTMSYSTCLNKSILRDPKRKENWQNKAARSWSWVSRSFQYITMPVPTVLLDSPPMTWDCRLSRLQSKWTTTRTVTFLDPTPHGSLQGPSLAVCTIRQLNSSWLLTLRCSWLEALSTFCPIQIMFSHKSSPSGWWLFLYCLHFVTNSSSQCQIPNHQRSLLLR